MCFLQCSTKVCVQRDLIPPPLNQSSLLMVPPMMELPFLASHTNKPEVNYFATDAYVVFLMGRLKFHEC